MSFGNRAVLGVLAVLASSFLVGCGSSSPNNSVPPPSGGFSDTNLSGSYTFSIFGTDVDAAGNFIPYTVAGTITACGCSGGTISAGTVDITDASSAGPGIAVNASGSSYHVNANGTGSILLSIPSTSGNVAFTFAFALTDAAHGSIIEYDTNGTGSGTIDLQPSAVTLPNGAYAFSLSGGVGTTTLGLVGDFTLASGSISTGLIDVNNNGIPATALSLTGSVSTGAGTSPGGATLSYGSTTLHLDVYAVDATHLKLIESDSQAVLVGDLFSEPGISIPSGNLVFTMAGLDSSGAPFAAGGTVASDGSATLSSGSEDVNDAGTLDNSTNPAMPYSFTGSFVASPSGSGRFQVGLSRTFVGGTNFAAYPSSGGILMLEIDSAGNLFQGITGGVAMAQTSGATALAASQGFAMNLTGFDVVNGVPLDQIAQFNTTSTSLSGVLDQNDFGFANPTSHNISGTYSPGATGSVTLTSTESTFTYAVNSTTALALATDPNEVSTGVFEQQGSPTSTADVTQRHLAIIRSVRAAARKRTK